MTKKIIYIVSFILIINSHAVADERDDVEYINRLNQKGYSNELVIEGEKFLKKYPESDIRDAVTNIIAYNYYKLEKYDQAYGKFRKLRDTKFKNEAYYFLIIISLKRNELYNIDSYLSKIDSGNSLKYNSLYYIGEYFYKRKDYTEAKRYYRELLKTENKYTDLAFKKLGLIYYRNEEYLRASIVLEEYINNLENENDSDKPLLLYVLGKSYEKVQEPDKALKRYTTLEKLPDNEYKSIAMYRAAIIYNKMKETSNLANQVRKLIDTEYYSRTLVLLARQEYENENYDKAEKAYKKALDNGVEDNDKVNYELILSFLKQEKYDQALVNLKTLEGTRYQGEYVYYTSYILNKQNEYTDMLNFEKNVNFENVDEEYREETYKAFAEAAYKNTEYNKALEYFKKLDGVKYIYKILDIYIKQENTPRVIETMDTYKIKYKEDESYRREITNMVGEFLIREGKLSVAEKYYDDYLKDHHDKDIVGNLVYTLYEQEKYEKMIEVLNNQEITEENSYKKGLAYLGLKDYENAAVVFKSMLSRENIKNEERVYEKLIAVLYNQNKYDEQIKICNEYLEKGYTSKETWVIDKKGQALFQLEKYQEAIPVYNRLKEYDDQKDYAYFQIAEIKYNLDNKEEALKNYEHIVSNFPGSEYKKRSLYWIITIKWQQEEYEETVKYINWFLENYDDNEYLGEVIYYLGNIYLKEDKPELAIAEYKKVLDKIEDSDTKDRIKKELLQMYYNIGEYEEALKLVQQFNDEYFKMYWEGLIYEEQGNIELAIKRYKEVIENDDYGDRVNYHLGVIYLEDQKYTLARDYLSRVLDYEVSQFKDRAAFNIGESYSKEGKYQSAINALLKIKLIYVNSELQDIATIKIAENYEKLGEMQKSINAYLEFYKNYKDSQYFDIILERILQYYLESQKIDVAEKFYSELIESKPEKKDTYEKYFKNEGGNE